jgi:SH3-like domain-containing protein
MARIPWVRAIASVTLAVGLVIFWEGTACATSGAEVALPYFAALHADKVNLRAGPGDRYPIEWVYIRRDWPVQVIAHFDHWRRVRDWEGTEGWVHEKMLTAQQREVIVSGGVRGLHQNPDPNAALVARAEPGVMAKLDDCRGEWCEIAAGGITGWVPRSEIWGVSPTETVR